jgi:hypothetical protein
MLIRDVQEQLRACAALVRQGWCKNNTALDAQGKLCSPRESRAVAWCAIGAMQKIANGGPADGWEMRVALRNVITDEIVVWNDSRQYAEQVAQGFEDAAEHGIRALST